jgi:exosortase F-associated protein
MEAATSVKMPSRIVLAVVGFLLIAISYLYQYTDVLLAISRHTWREEAHFIVNRIFRIILNDMGMVLIIYAVFIDKQILKLAVLVQLIDLLILLPLYLLIKLPTEGISELSSPFLSQFHRVIVNPILMILLIPAIYYQKLLKRT